MKLRGGRCRRLPVLVVSMLLCGMLERRKMGEVHGFV